MAVLAPAPATPTILAINPNSAILKVFGQQTRFSSDERINFQVMVVPFLLSRKADELPYPRVSVCPCIYPSAEFVSCSFVDWLHGYIATSPLTKPESSRQI